MVLMVAMGCPMPPPGTSADEPPSWESLDDDGDGWSNGDELLYDTDFSNPHDYPGAPDADGDGYSDAWENAAGSNPANPYSFPGPGMLDSDGDGYSDVWENAAGTSPYHSQSYPGASDLDGDGYSDGWESWAGTDWYNPYSYPGAPDADSDGYSDPWENATGTDPNNPYSFPGAPDADGDGYSDAWESAASTNPNHAQSYPGAPDADSDGYSDAWETETGADPNNPYSFPGAPDTDGDGYSDAWENAAGSDPFQSGSYPGSVPPGGGGGSGGSPDGWLADYTGDAIDDLYQSYWTGDYEGILLGRFIDDPALPPLPDLTPWQLGLPTPAPATEAWPDGGIDSDHDGLSDAFEIANQWTETIQTGEDEFGVPQYGEVTEGLDPHDPDSDGDGALDGWEVRGLTPLMLGAGRAPFDPLVAEAGRDDDADGLSTIVEYTVTRTSPFAADTDADSYSDHQEIAVLQSDPLDPADPGSPDSDGDGFSDAEELAAGTNPLDPASSATSTGGGSGSGSGSGGSGSPDGDGSGSPPPVPPSTPYPSITLETRRHQTTGGQGAASVEPGADLEIIAKTTDDLMEYEWLLANRSTVIYNHYETLSNPTEFSANFYQLTYEYDVTLDDYAWIRQDQVVTGSLTDWADIQSGLEAQGWNLDYRADTNWVDRYQWEVHIETALGGIPGWADAYTIRGPTTAGDLGGSELVELLSAAGVQDLYDDGVEDWGGSVGGMAFGDHPWSPSQRLTHGDASPGEGASPLEAGASAEFFPSVFYPFPSVSWTELWYQAETAIPQGAGEARETLLLHARKEGANGELIGEWFGQATFTLSEGQRTSVSAPAISGELPPGWVQADPGGSLRLTPPVEEGVRNSINQILVEFEFLTRDPDGGVIEDASGILTSTNPTPEIEMSVTQASISESGDLEIDVEGFATDRLGESIADGTGRVAGMEFFVNGVSTGSRISMAFAPGGIPPFSYSDSRTEFRHRIVVPDPKPGAYIVTVKTDPNAAGTRAWDKVAAGLTFGAGGVAASSGPNLPIEVSSPTDPASINSVKISGFVFEETEPDSLTFAGQISIGGELYEGELRLAGDIASDPDLPDSFLGNLSCVVIGGGDGPSFLGTWTETEPNSGVFQINLSADLASAVLAVGSIENLPGSQQESFEPVVVRIKGAELLPASMELTAKAGGQIYEVHEFEYGGTPEKYLVRPSAPNHPGIWIASEAPLPPSHQAPLDQPYDQGKVLVSLMRANVPIAKSKVSILPGPLLQVEEEPSPLSLSSAWQPGEPITRDHLVTAYRFIYTDEFSRSLLDAFLRMVDTDRAHLQLGDIWGDSDLEYLFRPGSKALVQIENDDAGMHPGIAAQLLWHQLTRMLLLVPEFQGEANLSALDNEEMLQALETIRAQIGPEVCRAGVAAAEIYLSGIGLLNEGAEWALIINDASNGHWASLGAALPFVPRGLFTAAAGTVAAGAAPIVFRIRRADGTLIETIQDVTKLDAISELRWTTDLQVQGTILDQHQFTSSIRRAFNAGGPVREPGWWSRGGLKKRMQAVTPRPSDTHIAHHDFPWEFKENFARHGINVNDPAWGRWVHPEDHDLWHAGAGGGDFNRFWADFFNAEEDINPYTITQILAELARCRAQFPVTVF